MNTAQPYTIQSATPDQAAAFGNLLVDVYSALPGFPEPDQQPQYYDMLRHVGRMLDKPATDILLALSPGAELLGGVVYFGDMSHYGSGGSATSLQNSAGIRLLGVAPAHCQAGVGKALTLASIQRAREEGRQQMVLHTTAAMQQAWAMYERLGFTRFTDIDFMQQTLPVFGFRLPLF